MLEIFLSCSRMKGSSSSAGLALLVVDEVGRQVAAVELHALDDVQLVVQALAFFDGDDAFLADLLHRLGDDLADGVIGVGGDGADLGDLLVVGAGLGQAGLSSRTAASTALSMPRFRSIGFMPAATAFRPSRTMACASTVAVVVPSPATSEVWEATSFHHLGAHVLELVLELDLLGDGDAVLGDGRRAEGLLEHDVAALRAQGDLDRVGEDVDAVPSCGCGLRSERTSFAAHGAISSIRSDQLEWPRWGLDRMDGALGLDDAHDVVFAHHEELSSPSSLTSVPEYLPNRTRSPTLTSSERTSPLSRSCRCRRR
jgi:hypothetical protein